MLQARGRADVCWGYDAYALSACKNKNGEPVARFPEYSSVYSGRAWIWKAALSNGLIGMPIEEPSGSLP